MVTRLALVFSLAVLAGGCAGDRGRNSPADDDDSVPTDDDDSATADDDDSGAEPNQPPEISSTPVEEMPLSLALAGSFEPGRLFMSSSKTDEVRVYDATTLEYIRSMGHPLFSETSSSSYVYGPNGLAFNERGNLVVAAHGWFVEFSDYDVVYATYEKLTAEASENVAFDPRGNLYTTTSTGGSDELNQYRASDYAFERVVPVPAGAGQLTGITFDARHRLYLASQADITVHVGEADPNFTTFTWIDSISASGLPGNLEGIQVSSTGDLVAAGGDMALFDRSTGALVGTFDAPEDYFPVPVRVDNEGTIFTADFENGSGSASADLVRFSPDGATWLVRNDPGLFGPFGGAVSGTVLAGDPPVEYSYVAAAVDPDGDPLTWSLLEGPEEMSIDGSGRVSWWLTSEAVGVHVVRIRVEDGRGGWTEQLYTLTVTAS